MLRRIRLLWRPRPRQALVLFFDVHVMAVKASGGRQETSAPRLVFARQHKTRGKGSLVRLSEVTRGRTHGAFVPGKSAAAVCQFRRRVRRWYPGHAVCIARDQDRAHPCTSRQTQQTMRALQWHWIAWPTGSPDDHPVETRFSDIHAMLLANCHDADARTTHRRLRAHWRGRNRRHDRHSRIPYVAATYKPSVTYSHKRYVTRRLTIGSVTMLFSKPNG